MKNFKEDKRLEQEEERKTIDANQIPNLKTSQEIDFMIKQLLKQKEKLG